MLAGSLAAALVAYGLGLARLWRHAGVGRGVTRLEALAFAAGWLVLLAALSGPMDEISDRWLVAHMLQHELLIVVAAPLIAFSAPLVAALWSMPGATRIRVAGVVRRPAIAAIWMALSAPLTVFALHAIALWVWHLPALYDFALGHEWAHVLEHLCFFGTAALFWWGIAHGRYGRAGYGVAVVYVFATAAHSGVLGALLTCSPRVWYAPYLVTHPSGVTPLEDQQLAGLLMWVPAGVAFVAGALALFAAWLRQSDRMTRFQPAPARQGPIE
jgi:cytochrome c oxidase assembly factor CtaG